MSAASGARLSVPAWAVAPPVRPGAAPRHEHPRLALAGRTAGAAPAPEPEDDDPATASHRGAGVRVSLAPRAEPAACPIPARTPAHVLPPVLGSAEALARRSAAPAAGGPGSGTQAEGPLPDPTRMCCVMVQAAVEALRGARPLAQLTRWVSPEVYDRLALRAQLVQDAGTPTTTGRAGIRRIRVCRIGHEAAEATVVVDDGPRVRAVAVRLEGHRGRWRATAMEIG